MKLHTAYIILGAMLALANSGDSMRAQNVVAPTGTVTGHVICADSHTPCRFASVTMQSVPPAQQGVSTAATSAAHSYAAATDLEGAYTMQSVAPGDYYITALETGYLSSYDLAANEFAGDPALKPQAVEIALQKVTVSAGQTTPANLLLYRGATLAGTVRYDDGGAGMQLSIHLFRKDGAGTWQPYSNSAGIGDLARLGFGPKTDDRGRFYAPGLPPGSYQVQVELPVTAMLFSTITGRQSVDVKMTQGGALKVFYGDVYRTKQAKLIELHAGEDRTDIDLNIPTSGLHSLQGTVTGPDGQILSSGKVRLLDPDDKAILRETALLPGGMFLFENVVNGSYLLQIEADRRGQAARLQPFVTPLLVENDLSALSYRLEAAK